jgi:hypothetical protein
MAYSLREPETERSTDCVVGLLDVREVDVTQSIAYLSVGEKAKYMSLPNEKRKGEWLAGRLAIKYLFLNRLGMSESGKDREWKPTLAKLTKAALGVFSSWMYQNVEVLPNGETPGRHLKLAWCGKDRPENIALSHADGISCACLQPRSVASIDVETTVPRVDAFSRGNFTEAERSWVARSSDGNANRSNWLFTLLWTLKETALKSGWLSQKSIWGFPMFEIYDLPCPELMRSIWSASAMAADFVVFPAIVKEHRRVMRVQVGLTGTRDLILTVMNPMTGEFN